MGRPRSFDTETAVAQALNAFWARGYAATSVEDLCQAMGLSRSSLYEAFGSKRGVWLAAMDHYEADLAKRLGALLRSERPIGKALEAFLMRFVDLAVARAGPNGCFIGNCVGEMATTDPQAAARLGRGLAAIEDVMYEALRAAQSAGELDRDTDVRALARFMMATVQGLRLVAKANPDRAALSDVVRQAMRAVH